MLRILYFLVALAFLVGCAPTSKPILLDESAGNPEAERKWAKYGAYYLTDELFVEASFESHIADVAFSKYIVNKKMKILTREGVEHGTIHVPFYTTFPPKMTLLEWDSAGRPVHLDTESMGSEYRKTGKLIFPSVTAGCMLEVHMEFSANGPVPVFEHWFSGPVPVAHGRLTFSRLKIFDYEFATYGPLKEVEAPRNLEGTEDLEYSSWDVHDIFPRSRLDFQEDIDAAEPRVSVALRHFQNQPVITNWRKLSERYEEAALHTSFFQSTRKLTKKVDEITTPQMSSEEKAKAVFQWVQDNISFKQTDLNSIDPDHVMSTGQGNMWEMAVVLREMFKHLGLATDVVVTRPRSMGGFDPKFETPLQLAVPLVVVTVGTRNLLSFPYSRGAALGEYPEDFYGLKALSLSSQDSTSVPEFASGGAFSHSVYRIDPSAPEAGQEMEMELGGYLAFEIRNVLMQEQKQDVKDVFQRMLTQLGTSNALSSCHVDNLNDRGKPMTAKLGFANPTQSVERKGEVQMKLSNIFPIYFASYDTSRATGFKSGLESEHVERLEVAKAPGKKLEAAIPCRPTSNALFKVTCSTEETDKTLIFTRGVYVHRKKLSAAEMRLISPEITELNRIGEARVVLRSSAAATAASAAKGTATSKENAVSRGVSGSKGAAPRKAVAAKR